MNDVLITRPGFDPLLTEPSLSPSVPGKIAAEFAAESRTRESESYGRASGGTYTPNVGPSSDDIQAFNSALCGESVLNDSAEMLPNATLGHVTNDASRGMDAKVPLVPAELTAAQPAPTHATPAQIPAGQPAPMHAAPAQIPAGQPAPMHAAPAQIAAGQSAPAHAAPAQIAAGQPAPTQAAPAQIAAGQPAPTHAAPVQIAAEEPALTHAAPAQIPAGQPAPMHAAPAQIAAEQPAPAQPTAAMAHSARAEAPPNAAAETLGKARPHLRSAQSDREMPVFSAALSAELTPALPVTGVEFPLAQQSQLVADPAAAASAQASVRDPLSAEHMVQYVTRTLARRDLEALNAGREVVLRLDDRLLPETTLTFRPLTDDLLGGNPAQPPQVVISLQTESPEVHTFLTAHADDLVEAMSREAPGICWELDDEFYRAPSTSGASERSAALTDQDLDSQASNEPGSRGDRSSGQDQPGDNPQGQAETFEEDTLAYGKSQSASAPESLQGQGSVDFETLVDD